MKFKIERLDNFGRGISYCDDKIIFIENALHNEIVDAEITYFNKKYLEGKVNSIEIKSEDRINPICQYYDICGGCNLLHMNYDNQLKFKYNKVTEIVHKYLKEDVLINPVVSSKLLNYRNKASFKVNNKLCYTKRKSNDLVQVDYCYLNDDKINEIVKIFNSFELNSIDDVLIKCGNNDVMVVINGEISCDIINLLKDKSSSIYVNEKLVYGKPYIESKIGNYKFVVSPKSFFQVNSYNVKNLYDLVLKYANLKGDETILDLYCGTGTIGIYLSSKASRVIGIEINEQAIMDANINKELNNVKNISFICNTTSNINDIIKENFDLIIVDPPRSGLDKNTVDYIMNSGVNKVIYVSCDIMTLMRDLNILKNKYNIKEMTPVDMFPNTYHVECVCVLKLK